MALIVVSLSGKGEQLMKRRLSSQSLTLLHRSGACHVDGALQVGRERRECVSQVDSSGDA